MNEVNPVYDWEYVLSATIQEESANLDGPRIERHSDYLMQSASKQTYKPYHEQGSDGGTIMRIKLAADIEQKIMTVSADGKARAGHGHRLAAHIENGGKITTNDARKLAWGMDPNTDEWIAPERVKFNLKKDKLSKKQREKLQKKHIAAQEQGQSTAKDPNLFWMDAVIKGDFEWAEGYDKAMRDAWQETMQYAHDELAAYQTRRSFTDSEGKRQRYYEQAVDVMAVVFQHQTSRPTGNGESNGTPQNHFHVLNPNMVLCSDGHWRSLDSSALHYHRPTIDAYFKMAFYEKLRALPGMADMVVEMNGPVERIKGLPEKMIKDFSPRRNEMLDKAASLGLSTADRRAMKIIAKQTRGDKDSQPPLYQLVKEWEPMQKKHLGDKSIFEVMAKREQIAETPEEKLERVALKAMEMIGANDTVVSDRDVRTAASRACVGEYGPAEFKKVLDHIKIKHLTLYAIDDQQRLQFAVKHLVEKEHRFMKAIDEANQVNPLLSHEDAVRMLAELKEEFPKFKILSDEQDAAIVGFLTTGEIAAALVGPPGTGKSTLLQAFRIIAEDKLGYEILVASPSWKAATSVGVDMGLAPGKYMASAKMIAELKVGRLKFHTKTIVLMDEAGMSPIEDAEFLLSKIKDTYDAEKRDGGQLHMVGDPTQLAPVASGTPMSILMDMKGAHKLTIIQRQRDDRTPETIRHTARLREAISLLVRAGDNVTKNKSVDRDDTPQYRENGEKKDHRINEDILRSLEIFDEEGCIVFCNSREEAINKAADDYVSDLNEAISRGCDAREVIYNTKRNVDVHDTNAEITATLLDSGYLNGVSVTMDTYQRNNKDSEYTVQLTVYVNSRIAFGGRQNNLNDPYNKDPEALTLVGQEKLKDVVINNSDFATVRGIKEREGQEPLIGIELDKHPGHVFWLTPSELAVDNPYVDRPKLPVMQEGWVGTIHSLQGASILYGSNINITGNEFRQLLVGESRMKNVGRQYVNVERFELNALDEAGIVYLEEDGKVTIPHRDGDRTLSPEEFKMGPRQYLLKMASEASRSEVKTNYTDHDDYKTEEGKKAFLAAERPWELHEKRLIAREKDKLDNLDRRIINEKARHSGEIGKTSGIYVDPVKPKPEHILKGEINPFEDVKPIERPTMEVLKTQKEKIMAGNYESRRISDAEKAKFYDTNPIDILRHFGVQDIPGSNNNGKTDNYNLCMDVVKGQPKGKMYLAKGDHGWVITEWSSGNSVRIDTWLYHNGNAASVPQAWHLLRDLMSTAHLKDSNYKAEPRKIEPPKPLDVRLKDELDTQAQKSKFPSFPETPDAKDKLNRVLASEGDKSIKGRQATQLLEVIHKGELPNASAATKELATKVTSNVEAEKGFFVSKLEMMRPLQPAAINYMKNRGIHPATLVAVDSQMPLRDAPIKCQKTNQYVGGVGAFHMGPEGPIGYDIKRDVAFKKEGDGFKQFDAGMYSPGGGRSLGMVGYPLDKSDAKKIIVVESTPDLAAMYQMTVGYDLPHVNKKLMPEFVQDIAQKMQSRLMEEKIAIVSTAGRPSSTALVMIEDIAKRNGKAEWSNGMDFDPSGMEFRKAVSDAVRSGNPQADIKNAFESYYKDANDKLLNKPLSVEAIRKTVDSVRTDENPTRAYNKPRDAYEVFSEANILKKMEAYNRDHPDSKVKLDDYRGVGFTDAEVKQFKASIAELKATQAYGEAKISNEIVKLSHILAQPSAFQRPHSTLSKPAEKPSEEIRLEEKPRSVEPKTSQSNRQEQTAKTHVQPSNRGFTRPAVTMRQAEAAASARQQKAAEEARAREAAAIRAQQEAERASRGYSM